MTNPYRAMCAELLQELCCHYRSWELKEGHCSDAMTRARALLDQREPQPPAAGEVAEVLQWPAEWSRRQRAQEAEMLCCSAGMTPGKEMQQLVRDARDGMPLQHLHDLISHVISTPEATNDY